MSSFMVMKQKAVHALRVISSSGMVLVCLSHFLCTGSHTPLEDAHDLHISMSRIVHTCITAM
jgi:hypothetical protein